MPRIVHIVLFQFKAQAHAQAITKICDDMLALRQNCLHPQTGRPYIVSLEGGRDNSPEGAQYGDPAAQHGMTHGFVVEFSSIEDRNYYLDDDPVHLAFKKAAGNVLEAATVVDFEPNKF